MSKDSREEAKRGVKIIPDAISPILEPLISELRHESKNFSFERLEPLLIEVMRSCYKRKDLALEVSKYLVSSQDSDLLHDLSSMAAKALDGNQQYCTFAIG